MERVQQSLATIAAYPFIGMPATRRGERRARCATRRSKWSTPGAAVSSARTGRAFMGKGRPDLVEIYITE